MLQKQQRTEKIRLQKSRYATPFNRGSTKNLEPAPTPCSTGGPESPENSEEAGSNGNVVPQKNARISWTAKKTNDTVLEEAHTTRLLISKIRKRQATFFGHVMRREKLENLVTTGMLEGKRSRGKQREKLIEGLTDWLKAGKSLEAIEATKDRKKWRTMIPNAVKQGT
ncbi:endonuclease-reverse transcriptase [Plakobranchus ocellatus]|uniref:Endonuclease-reverse transcriptase n=1 Tax=Plakobranchus ocellatus TaxID=259542 RepID=A0AAV3Y744_9GAST|nr:endonuclease-reverse transcriptase [Plakobranchus ocellatus]